jgi:SulP family sulfate permease
MVLGRRDDAVAFVATLIATFLVDLDVALYLGVGISLVLFLRRARHLRVRRLAIHESGAIREYREVPAEACRAIAIVQVEGQLFFASANTLEDTLNEASADPECRVVILRVKRTLGLDATAADVLIRVGQRLADSGRALYVVGMRKKAMRILRGVGVEDALGADHLFPTRPTWFRAMDTAIEAALEVVGAHPCGDTCPLEAYIERRSSLRAG